MISPFIFFIPEDFTLLIHSVIKAVCSFFIPSEPKVGSPPPIIYISPVRVPSLSIFPSYTTFVSNLVSAPKTSKAVAEVITFIIEAGVIATPLLY